LQKKETMFSNGINAAVIQYSKQQTIWVK
jgi:hypothetical protein